LSYGTDYEVHLYQFSLDPVPTHPTLGSQARIDEVRTVNSVLTFCIGRLELKPRVADTIDVWTR
jgi:hypothetical protein